MSIYVGKAFSESWRFVSLLLVSAVFLAIASFAGSLYGALKKSKFIMTTSIIASVVNIILNYVFINMVGVYGAVIGTVSAYFIVAILRLIDLRKRMNVDFHLKKIGLLTVIVLAQATMVGLDYHIYLVSIVAIIIFFIVTRKDIISIVLLFRQKLQSRQ